MVNLQSSFAYLEPTLSPRNRQTFTCWHTISLIHQNVFTNSLFCPFTKVFHYMVLKSSVATGELSVAWNFDGKPGHPSIQQATVLLIELIKTCQSHNYHRWYHSKNPWAWSYYTTDKDWYYKCLYWFTQQTNIYLASVEQNKEIYIDTYLLLGL